MQGAKMKQYDLCGIGNALVDIEVQATPSELMDLGLIKGQMTLVDAPRMIELLNHFGSRLGRRACGGSAANTVITSAHFGARTHYQCRIASDDTGEFFLKDLIASGVDTPLQSSPLPQGYTGTCLVIITPDADRTMITYLGITADFSKADIQDDIITRSRYLYIEGYLMAGASSFEAALHASYVAKQRYTKVAFTFSDLSMVTHFSPQIDQFLSQGIDLLFCNKQEALAFTHTSDIHHSARILATHSKKGAITLGAEGALVWQGLDQTLIPAPPTNAIDTTGAGDCFAGAFIAALLTEHDLPTAGQWGCKSASELVSQFGPRLTKAQVLNLDLL